MGWDLLNKAESFLREKGQEFVDGAKQTYQDMVGQATEVVKSVTPEGAHNAIDSISSGISTLGADAIDFFDPISYGTDLLADAAKLAQPEHQLNKYLATTLLVTGKGDKEQAKKILTDEMLDESLLAVQAGALALPSGHIAGKAAGRALQKGVKAAKKTAKETIKGTPERIVAEQQLRRARQKKFVGKRAAKYSGKFVDQTVRDITTNERSKLSPGYFQGKRTSLKPRDWSQFGKQKQKEVLEDLPTPPEVPQRRRGDWK